MGKFDIIFVEFDQAFKERTIEFCKDELQWHLDEGKPDEYPSENLAEIELLYKLGEVDEAEAFARSFIDALSERIKGYDAYEYQEVIKYTHEQIRDIEKLIKRLKKEVKHG